MERHFHGEYGLQAELIDAGIMDSETKVIKDPRRVLNSDETPQPIDAPQKGRRPKVAKRQGQRVRKSGSANKEQVSVNMTWDLSGHMYGVQVRRASLPAIATSTHRKTWLTTARARPQDDLRRHGCQGAGGRAPV